MSKQRLIDRPTEELIKLELDEIIALFLEEKGLDFSESVRFTQSEKTELDALVNHICKDAVDKKIVTIKNKVNTEI